MEESDAPGVPSAAASTASASDLLPVASRIRPTHVIYAVLLLSAGAVLVYALSGSGSGSGPGRKPDAPAVAAPRPTPDGPAASRPPPAAPSPAEPSPVITGVPEVIDTVTMRVDQRIVRLFGVEWQRGAQAEDLTRYIAGRPVVCDPVPGLDRHRCRVGGRDLSEVVIYNGGGRTTSEATPDLKAAEDAARQNGLGIWQKR